MNERLHVGYLRVLYICNSSEQLCSGYSSSWASTLERLQFLRLPPLRAADYDDFDKNWPFKGFKYPKDFLKHGYRTALP
jgi:hypothetical protein